MTSSPQSPQGKSSDKPQRTVAEWTTFGIASGILGAIAGLVIYAWATEDARPPVVEVQPSPEIREAKGKFYVPFTVSNTGGETVESVQVIAELRVNGQIEESGDQHIDFLSDGETQEGAFIFRRDPRQGNLTVRVASYKLP
ncbi:TIGR02588 family protein [Myxacorys almedinensis]|uniref:TIGR02588 family protein n=1 Tax=Myxacorys almedinensis A TaxID=2690445 RepID=A0A8J7Z201_9CYAN|nr:TIGR02588 family protein [Myxacorys almedinensis]NDJ17785.1 TIGR02588 family protein [Myxacorys almedinensis A]